MNLKKIGFDEISNWLKALIMDYGFSIETLSNYLFLTREQILWLSDGKLDFLSDENLDSGRVFDKVAALYLSAEEDRDLELAGFLGVLINYHRLSQQTIAKMSGVEVMDVENLLQGRYEMISESAKYRMAVTVMSLRFCLKESEPKDYRIKFKKN